MLQSVNFRMQVWLVLAFLAGCATGCGDPPSVVVHEVPETQDRLMAIKKAYTRFSESNKRPPRNKKELVRQLRLDNENADEVLLSPRDGEPFVIGYRVDVFDDLDWAAPESFPAYAHEQSGADGTLWVLSIPGAIYELSEEEFAKVVFPPGSKTP